MGYFWRARVQNKIFQKCCYFTKHMDWLASWSMYSRNKIKNILIKYKTIQIYIYNEIKIDLKKKKFKTKLKPVQNLSAHSHLKISFHIRGKTQQQLK